MVVSAARTILSLVACASLALCGIPACAFAGGSATAAEQAANDAAIQAEIDGMDGLAAGEDYVDGQILVTYSGEEEPEQVDLAAGTSVQEALEGAQDDDMVVAAQPNCIYRLLDEPGVDADGSSSASVDDASSSLQYYLDGDVEEGKAVYRGANIKGAWALAKSNSSVTVAVLDTGVQASHEDLEANIDKAHMASVSAKGEVKVGAMRDEDGHGTHVAGIVSAAANNEVGVAGVSYNATVLPIRVFENHVSTTLQCVAAVEYLDGLVESGQLANLHVMNMSLGSYGVETSTDKLLREEILHMRQEHGVVTVCAGGNGRNGRPLQSKCFPADWSECVSVTSLTAYGENSSWSDYNASKDISAPGEEILSTYSDAYARECREYGDENLYEYGKGASYGFMEGTSMAAPLVSGVMALLWATYPQLSVDDAVTAVKTTARETTPSLHGMFQDFFYEPGRGSAGLIDACAAVAYVQQLAQAKGAAYVSGSEPQPVVSTAPAKVRGVKAASAARGLNVAWTGLSGAAGYQVRYKLKGSSAWKTKAVKNALAASVRVTGLKAGRKYTVQVRAWRLKASGTGKLYGAWSAVKVGKAA